MSPPYTAQDYGRAQNGKTGGACQLDLEDLARLTGRVALDRNRDPIQILNGDWFAFV